MFVSTDTVLRIFVFLLYAPIVLISYWKLIPRLSPTGKRIASGFLAAQVILIAMSLDIQFPSAFERRLWDLGNEWNIPSVFSSTQMALVGFAALATAWLARARPAWRRLYLVGIGLLFLYIGLDKFFAWKNWVPNWQERYMLVGAAVTGATISIAVDSPRSARIWHLCLLAGLALTAMGGLVVDNYFQGTCGYVGSLRFDKCLKASQLETPLELLGIWLALAAMLGHFSDAVWMSNPRVRRFLYVLPALWILLLFQSEDISLTVPIAANAQPAAVEFESNVHLHGFHIKPMRSCRLLLTPYLSPRQGDFNGLGHSIHLVDQTSGVSIARYDMFFGHGGEWLLGPDYVSAYGQRMKVKIPLQAAANRALWIALKVWREKDGEYVHQQIIASDHPLLDDTQVILGELPPLVDSPPPRAICPWYNSLGDSE